MVILCLITHTYHVISLMEEILLKSVVLEGYELSPNVRKVCFSLLVFFVVVTGASIFGLNVPEKIKYIASFVALPAGVLLNASRLQIWVKK